MMTLLQNSYIEIVQYQNYILLYLIINGLDKSAL